MFPQDLSPEVNMLFRTNTVEKVQEILSLKRTEVEKKKDELRSLVGERHRDVIETSDAILTMKDLAASVVGLIGVLDNQCNIWNAPSKRSKSLQGGIAGSTCAAAHLKCLLEILELIRCFLDSADNLSTAVLLLVGRYVCTKVQLSGAAESVVVDSAIFLKRSWSSLNHLDTVLLSACRRQLSSPPCSFENSCRSLVALILVENMTMESCFLEYLRCRKLALEKLFETGGFHAKRSLTQFGLKLQTTLMSKFLFSLVESTEYLFFDDCDSKQEVRVGALRRRVSSLRNWRIKDSKFVTQDRLYAHLSEGVLNFSPTQMKPLTDEEYDGILVPDSSDCRFRDHFEAFWSDVIQYCQVALSDAFHDATNLKNLLTARSCVLNWVLQWQSCQVTQRKISTPTSKDSHSNALDSHVPEYPFPARFSPFLSSSIDLWRNLFGARFLEQISKLLNRDVEVLFDWFTTELKQLSEAQLQRVSPLTVSEREPQRGNFICNATSPGVKAGLIDFLFTDSNWNAVVFDSVSHSSSVGLVNPEAGTTSSQNDPTFLTSSSFMQMLHPETVGLIVFCRLTSRPITPSLAAITRPREVTTSTPIAHLLVFLQRLTLGYAASLPVDHSINGPVGRHLSSTGKLSCFSPTLRKICYQFEEKLADVILMVAQSAGPDYVSIWQIILSGMKMLMKKCITWLSTVANGDSLCETVGTNDPLLNVSPITGLYLARAFTTLIDVCPTVGAAVVAATGVIESSDRASSSPTEITSNSTDREFTWSHVTHLRSAWTAVLQPLEDVIDRLIVHCVTKAVVGSSFFEHFHDRICAALCIVDYNPNTSRSPKDALLEESISHLLMDYSPPGPFSHLVNPFEDISLNPDALSGDDSTTMTVLKIPSSASLPLHEFLLNAVQVIGLLVADLPLRSAINRAICLRVCFALLDQYAAFADRLSNMCAADDSDKNQWSTLPSQAEFQPIALQLVFDVRFLHLMLLWKPPPESINETTDSDICEQLAISVQRKYDNLLQTLESFIDPFDWEVCLPKLVTSVEQCLAASLHLYSPLMRPRHGASCEPSDLFVSKNHRETSSKSSLLPLISSVSSEFPTLPLCFTNIPSKKRLSTTGKDIPVR